MVNKNGIQGFFRGSVTDGTEIISADSPEAHKYWLEFGEVRDAFRKQEAEKKKK